MKITLIALFGALVSSPLFLSGQSALSGPSEILVVLEGARPSLGDGFKYFNGLALGEEGPRNTTRPVVEVVQRGTEEGGTGEYEVSILESYELATRIAKVSARAKGKFKAYSGSASGQRSSMITRESNEIFILVSYSATSKSHYIREATIKPGLFQDPRGFVLTAGEYYIHQIDEGFKLEAIGRYTFSSVEEKRSAKASMSSSYGGMAEGSAGLSNELNKLATTGRFEASIIVVGDKLPKSVTNVAEFKKEVGALINSARTASAPIYARAKPLLNLLESSGGAANEEALGNLQQLSVVSEFRERIENSAREINGLESALRFLKSRNNHADSENKTAIAEAAAELGRIRGKLQAANRRIVQNPFALTDADRDEIVQTLDLTESVLDAEWRRPMAYYGRWEKVVEQTTPANPRTGRDYLSRTDLASLWYRFAAIGSRLRLEYQAYAGQQPSFNRQEPVVVEATLAHDARCKVLIEPVHYEQSFSGLTSEWRPEHIPGWSSLALKRSDSQHPGRMTHTIKGTVLLPFKLVGPLFLLPTNDEQERGLWEGLK